MTDRADQARAYEAAHNRLFLVRLLLYALMLSVYVFSGASAGLADGLRARFGDAWWWVNAVYLAVTFFGFTALLFPLSLYSSHTLEHHYGLSRQSLGSWFADFLKETALEVGLGALLFSVVYAFLEAAPQTWWIWATLTYIALGLFMSAVWPVWIMPLFHDFEPVPEGELTRAVRQLADQSGIAVTGVYRWGLGEKTSTANAALAGWGRTRRILLADTMLDEYDTDEIIAVLAHEVGHFKHHDIWRMLIVGGLAAAAGLFVADKALRLLVNQLGFSGIADIAAFPVFLFALFLFSLITMPFSNAYSRRREYAADAYAVRSNGSAAPLTRALEKLADQNLADKEPAAWIEFLLHSHPSIGRRLARARAIETTLPPASP